MVTGIALPVEGGLLENRAWPVTEQDQAERQSS
jgi:hypothetical protein